MRLIMTPTLSGSRRAGYEDASPEAARRYRDEWLSRGAPWNDASTPHDGLTTEERLTHVPPGFE
jgi:hypothetical protein